MKKTSSIPLLVSIGTMVVLYAIGNMANIDFLIFKVSISHTEVAFLPIGVGLLVWFIGSRIYIAKFHS
ncbi:ATPase [Evansella tamaricis]|uniref:ATPase n=1 Tax=Evansella tamaricis TaxID=2069301 RepID=A0ABS6JEU6_9BACI|nr:ATPase [Evansella tamaricis]MBU9711915.1 ATPase [Evansella tamaricis]